MAKNAVTDWSTTAASNTDVGGINIQGSGSVSNGDDALREIMEQIATFITDANFALTSTDGGATGNPTLTLFRNSASPLAGDGLGLILFTGKDSGGTTTTYASITSGIADPTDGSEDGTAALRIMQAGTLSTIQNWATGTSNITATDNGAAVGPTLTLDRVSSTPAAADLLGSVNFTGRDSAAGAPIYATIVGAIVDPTDGTEDGALVVQVAAAGVNNTEVGRFTADGLTLLNADGGATIGPTLTLDRNSSTPAASDVMGAINFQGRDSAANGTVYATFFATIDDATNGSEDGALAVQAMTGGTPATIARFRGGSVRIGQDSTTTPGAGNNTVGSAFDNAGGAYFSSAGAALNVNRTADGNVAGFYSGGTVQGVISISGATVTYGAFSGSHWSQIADGSKLDGIPRGTIVDSIDKLCSWPGEINERLPCFKISDTQKSKRVYGVFGWWDQGEGPTNDAFIISLGAYLIRIDKGETVEGGDLIESAGNGCGRVQNNDAMRSSTVAKVTSTEVVDRYPDGSFTVPCTLHCG